MDVLPPEILEHIFSVCVAWLYLPKKPRHKLAWTQVCRHWRGISLTSSRLWQCIDLNDTCLSQEFLLRSNNAPLTLISPCPLKINTEHLHSHATRLVALDLFLFPDDMLDLFAVLGPTLSALTSLSLKIPPVSPTFILQTPIPSVRRLALDSVAVAWDTLSDLTHLTLRGLCPKFSPSISQIHDILGRSPSLVYLRLDTMRPSISTSTCTSSQLYLPILEDLIIFARAPTISALLAPLQLNTKTTLQLTCASFDDLRTFFPSSSLPYFSQTLPISGLRFARHSSKILRSPYALTKPWSESTNHTQFILDSVSCIATPFITSLPQVLGSNLSNIQVLEFNTGVLLDLSLCSLHAFLKHVNNVHTLRVAYNVLQDLLVILSPGKDGEIVLPNLKVLSFSKPSDLWWHFTAHWLPSVTQCLKLRAKALALAPSSPTTSSPSSPYFSSYTSLTLSPSSPSPIPLPSPTSSKHEPEPEPEPEIIKLQKLEFIKCHGVTPTSIIQIGLNEWVEKVIIKEPFESGRKGSVGSTSTTTTTSFSSILSSSSSTSSKSSSKSSFPPTSSSPTSTTSSSTLTSALLLDSSTIVLDGLYTSTSPTSVTSSGSMSMSPISSPILLAGIGKREQTNGELYSGSF